MGKIAIKLKAARESLGFTEQTLSMELQLKGYSVTKEAIEMYENEEIEPPVSYLKALVDILDVSPYFLLSNDSQVVKTMREPMVFIPFFDENETSSWEAYQKVHEYPTKYVAMAANVFEKIMSDDKELK